MIAIREGCLAVLQKLVDWGVENNSLLDVGIRAKKARI